MSSNSSEIDYFITSPIRLIENNATNQKTLSIPIKKSKYSSTYDGYDRHSKSWSGRSFDIPKNGRENHSFSPSDHQLLSNEKQSVSPPKSLGELFGRLNKSEKVANDIIGTDFRPYDAMNNCKSAGIIPYAIHQGTVYFLFQQTINPVRRKDSGWNDFGGKRNSIEESTADAAAREFSEETSCLFYLKEKNDTKSNEIYPILKHNDALYYDEETINTLRSLIPISQKHYVDKITEFVIPIYASSKETYISYFVKVDYIPAEDLPKAEDIHIDYEDRYMRTCKWFSYDEVLELGEKEFHKRLQITRIQQRIMNYYEKGLFT